MSVSCDVCWVYVQSADKEPTKEPLKMARLEEKV
jgi:hypothetical protein